METLNKNTLNINPNLNSNQSKNHKTKNMNQRIMFVELFYSIYVIGTIMMYPLLITIAIMANILKLLRNKFNKKEIAGKVAVITGSAGGLGREIAIELAKRGCHVAIVDIQDKLAEETAMYIAEKYNVKTKAYKIDVSDYQQLVKLRNDVGNDLGETTILINNAGILTLSTMIDPPPQEIQKMINVNFTSICFANQVFLPKMKELNTGHIVTIASSSALITSPYFHVYAATKAAVRSLMSALRIEIMNERKNITALTVMPLFLNTNKTVERLLNLTGLPKVMPLIEGDVVARYVVDGMINGADEITVPRSCIYIYKMLEILPVYVKEFGIGLATIRDYNKRLLKLKNN